MVQGAYEHLDTPFFNQNVATGKTHNKDVMNILQRIIILVNEVCSKKNFDSTAVILTNEHSVFMQMEI